MFVSPSLFTRFLCGSSDSQRSSFMEPPQSAGNRNASVPFLRDDVCGDQQLEIRSKGIWDLGSAESFLHYELPLLHLQLSVIFLLTYCLHFFLKRLRFPRIISEILVLYALLIHYLHSHLLSFLSSSYYLDNVIICYF